MDLFGGDSDTTEDSEDANTATTTGESPRVQSPTPLAVPPPAAGRALFARAVSDDTADGDAPDGDGDGGETKGEDPQPPHQSPTPPALVSRPPSSAAQPVKTLPRPVYDGDKLALIQLCDRALFPHVLDEARDLIARGINIDWKKWQNGYGETALMYATKFNNGSGETRLKLVQELIRAGAALDVQCIHRVGWGVEARGKTALMYAAAMGRLEIVQVLVRAGAALDVQDTNDGQTALMYAAAMGHLEIVQVLVRAGAALDVQDTNDGKTALMKAARLDVVQELVGAGAALDVQDKNTATRKRHGLVGGDTALTAAMHVCQANVVPCHLVHYPCRRHCYLSGHPGHGLYSAPHNAALARGREVMLKFLLDAGARCPGYKKSGWFNSTCKRCGGEKAGRWHDKA